MNLDKSSSCAILQRVQELLTHYVVGVLATTSLMMAWFESGLPYHVFDLLGYVFPWFKDNFRDTAGTVVTTRKDWDALVTASGMFTSPVAALFCELVSCRVCLSFHASFWVSVVMYATLDTPVLFIAAAALTWPYIINFLLTKLHHND